MQNIFVKKEIEFPIRKQRYTGIGLIVGNDVNKDGTPEEIVRSYFIWYATGKTNVSLYSGSVHDGPRISAETHLAEVKFEGPLKALFESMAEKTPTYIPITDQEGLRKALGLDAI